MDENTKTQTIEKWLRLVDKPVSKKDSKKQENKLEQIKKLETGRG